MKRYRLGKILGQGGMAIVHEGWRRLADGTEQPVAIKRIRPEYGAQPQVQAHFHREARLCIDLAHPNLVKVYDFDRNEDARIMARNELFIVMERIDGLSLSQLGQRSTLPYPVVRSILMQILYGLAYLHQRDIIHRDISPTNILVSSKGEVKIVDFGLAKILRAPMSDGGFKGNPPYACPEQLQGRDIDPSADLYALAAVVHELLAGSPPFGRGSLTTIGDRQSAEPAWALAPLPDAVPEDLRSLLARLLQPWVTRTLRSADEAAEALQQHQQPIAIYDELATLVQENMQTLPGTDLPRWPGVPPGRGQRRRWLRWSVPAMLLLGGLAAGMALHGDRARTDSPDAVNLVSRAEATIPAAPAAGEPCPVPPTRPLPESVDAAQEASTVSHPMERQSPRRGAARSEHSRTQGRRKIPIVEKTDLSLFLTQDDQP